MRVGRTRLTVFELLRRLKPLYGQKIDRLWIEYQLSDSNGRREIEQLVTLLAIKRLGMMIGDPRLVLDAPPPNIIGNGSLTIGMVAYPGLAPYPFRVTRNELLRHVFLLGPTGTGKTTLLLQVLQQLLAARIPVMIFDFKRNYRCLLNTPGPPVIFTVGRNHAPLALNVMNPPTGVAFEEWVEALAEAISTSYLLMHGARRVLKAALQTARHDNANATLRDVLLILQGELARYRSGRRRGWLESAARSVEELCNAGFGTALNAKHAMSVDELLANPVVFEVQGVGEDQKRFFCLYWLQTILLLRKHAGAKREDLQHVLLFDEAHHVFPREKLGEVSVPVRVAREIREYGEAIIAATQQSDVSESLIANAGIKLIMRCDYPRDILFASQVLQIEQKWLPKLSLGTCIARLPTRFLMPFLFTFPPVTIKNDHVTEETLRERWAASSFAQAQERPTTITDRERALLRDINTHPISNITTRYDRLAWNPKNGNETKNRLLSSGLATFHGVSTPTARVKILSLTGTGAAFLRSTGIAVRAGRSGGAEHEYWRHQLSERLERQGFHVIEEYPIGGGQTVDLRAKRGTSIIWCEIETGRSNVERNAKKIASLRGRYVFLLTNTEARRHAKHVLRVCPRAEILTTDELAAREW